MHRLRYAAGRGRLLFSKAPTEGVHNILEPRTRCGVVRRPASFSRQVGDLPHTPLFGLEKSHLNCDTDLESAVQRFRISLSAKTLALLNSTRPKSKSVPTAPNTDEVARGDSTRPSELPEFHEESA